MSDNAPTLEDGFREVHELVREAQREVIVKGQRRDIEKMLAYVSTRMAPFTDRTPTPEEVAAMTRDAELALDDLIGLANAKNAPAYIAQAWAVMFGMLTSMGWTPPEELCKKLFDGKPK